MDVSHRAIVLASIIFAADKQNKLLTMLPILPKYLLLTVLLASSFAKGFTQNANEFFFLNYTDVPRKDFKDIPGKSSLNNLEASLLTPTIKIGKRTTINNAFYYKLSGFDFKELDSNWDNLPEHLHDARYSLIIRHQFNQRWSLLAVPRLNARTDLKESLGQDDLFPGITTLLLSISSRNQNLRWGFGFTYNNDFRRNTILPAASLFYNSEKMRVNIILPSNGQVIWLPSERLEYGFSFNVDAGIYHTGIDMVNGSNVKYIRTFNVLVSPLVAYRIAGGLWINVKAGYMLFRNYDIWDDDYEAKNDEMENKLSAGPFVSVGISMRLNTQAKK